MRGFRGAASEAVDPDDVTDEPVVGVVKAFIFMARVVG
jgi:hypothetical protein